jgi:transposase
MKSNQSSTLNNDKLTLLKADNAALSEQVDTLKNQLDWFKRQLFGRKSEKQIIEDPQQINLFDLPKVTPPLPEETTEIKGHQRKSSTQRNGDEVNDSGLRFDSSVPQKIIDVCAPELQGPDADQYEIIGYKETNRLAQQPGSYVVLVYRRPVVRHKKLQTLTTVAAPDNVLEGCYADVSVLAGMMVDKAVYHLPLYRQHQRLIDAGFQLSRATLTNWIFKSIELLRPIYEAQRRHILKSQVLGMDEVPIKAGIKSKGKMNQTYFWPIYGDSDEIAFTWSKSRGTAHAIEQLTGFSGTLITDGYQAYTKAVKKLNEEDEKITHATCWAHLRRYFEKSLPMEPAAAQDALDIIAELYLIERNIRSKNLNADEIKKHREKYSEPKVTAFFNWVYEQRQRVDLLPSNPLSKALYYASERISELKVFLANPNVPVDTNHVERALRVIPMGRKNYLFCWSELGAEQLGILQSLMVTCRMQGVKPYVYLVDVLQRISQHPASEIDALTPRVWKDKFADDLLVSNLAILG